jgi:hypothetical protein
MNIHKISALMLAVSLSGIFPVGVALADDISNNLDLTVDASLEVMSVATGGTGAVSFKVHPTNGDGNSGCNLDSAAESVTFSVLTSNASVATVAPGSINFTGPGCNDTPSVTVTGVGAGSATISLSETSNTTGGTFNVAPAAFTVNVTAPADATPPVIVPTITPAPNGAGWNNTDVTVSWSVTDGESAISSTSGCGAVVLTSETAGTTLTCTATSEGGTSSESVTVKIDKTKPEITGSRAPEANGNGWNNTDVEVSFVCADTGDVQSGIATDTVAGATVSDEGAGQSVTNTGSCVDAAGNEADPATVSGINIDKTAPDVTIVTPEDGGSYTFKQTILANWFASDALSDIDTAVGTVPSGDPIDTSSLGAKSFTVTATDLAGNSSEVTASYDVVPYAFGGFGAPLTISAKDFKKMSTIPVKFQLFDTFGNPVGNAVATLTVNDVAAVSSGGSNVGNYFRYDPVKQQYIFNLSTKTLSLGLNTLKVTLDDGTEASTTITIK